ncbi:MAG TPA: MOSC N-terminal beta barrel domain-containing protein [Acidimicrobiia bacterium]|nr:MOSC N-terminal beta barrel domain-containing protein [Acidimicrobiia bacterium]
MSTETLVTVGRVGALWRYPVKSMLGEPLTSVDVSDAGFDGDRRFGVVDAGTGRIASAKRPRRWQRLLQLRAERAGAGAVRIRFPDGTSVVSGKDGPEDGTADVDAALTAFLGTDVRLRGEAPAGAEIERSVPEEVLAAGADADVGFTMLEMAAASPPGTFFDFSPLQLVTTASLDRAGAAHPAGRVEVTRYRPNVVLETTPELAGFVENDWVGRRLHLGPDVVVDVLVPSPRCAIPTLRHGDLPPDPDALRVPLRHNFVEVPVEGFGSAPCLGVHAVVVAGGRLSVGDEVRLA